MATNAVVTQPSHEGVVKKLTGTLPGILLLAVVGWAGKFIEQTITSYRISHHVTLPNIEYVLWAILIGLVISNTIGVPSIFRPGVATYDFWLKAGNVLPGARFLLGDIRHLGGISLLLVFLELAIALTLMTLLGRLFKLKPKLTTLLAVGSSICGVSAIIATQGGDRCGRGGFVLCDCGDPRRWCGVAVHIPADRARSAPERPRLRIVGRAGGGQYGGGDGGGRAVFR